jgi:hypothetical protein
MNINMNGYYIKDKLEPSRMYSESPIRNWKD